MERTEKIVAVGRRVAAFRVLAGFDQGSLAIAAGLSRAAVSRIERGVHVPHRATLAALALALGVSKQDLLAPGRLRPVVDDDIGGAS